MTLARLAALLLGLAAALGAHAAPPALVVVIVIDGLPQEQVVKYRDLYGAGGFKRLLEEGAWFANAHHGHAVTTTAPGHATILTGVYPHRHGVIDNDWIDPATLAQVYCVGDPAHRYIGADTKPLDGTSPANLRAPTLGDELKQASERSKVVAISGKDRSAILLAGQRGAAWMYMGASGRFASSSFYMKEHPAWHARYYEGRPQDRWMGQAWALLLPEAAYARSTGEGLPWQRRDYARMGDRFPFVLPGADRPDHYYYALMGSPFGDDVTLDFARAAIEGENLGRNPAGVPDLLALSLTTHDYVNHGFGPESRASQDHLLRADRALAAFFEYLERRVGRDRLLVALTSDHGFTNAPEHSAAKGLGGARMSSRKILADVNEHLAARFGAGNHVLAVTRPAILLDRKLIASKGLKLAEVESEAARFLEKYPGIAAVFTRSQLEGGALPEAPLAKMVQRSWHRERSGDLYATLAPHVIASSNVATHGSPYRDDTNVPLMLYGKAWIKPGSYQAAAVVDLVPTLAAVLGIRPPAGSEGRVLKEILK